MCDDEYEVSSNIIKTGSIKESAETKKIQAKYMAFATLLESSIILVINVHSKTIKYKGFQNSMKTYKGRSCLALKKTLFFVVQRWLLEVKSSAQLW